MLQFFDSPGQLTQFAFKPIDSHREIRGVSIVLNIDVDVRRRPIIDLRDVKPLFKSVNRIFEPIDARRICIGAERRMEAERHEGGKGKDEAGAHGIYRFLSSSELSCRLLRRLREWLVTRPIIAMVSAKI